MRYVECTADGVGQCVYCAAACVAECDAGIVGSQTEVLLECVNLENKFKTYTLYFTLLKAPFFSKTYIFYFANPTFYRFILLKLKASLVQPRAKQGKFPHILL